MRRLLLLWCLSLLALSAPLSAQPSSRPPNSRPELSESPPADSGSAKADSAGAEPSEVDTTGTSTVEQAPVAAEPGILNETTALWGLAGAGVVLGLLGIGLALWAKDQALDAVRRQSSSQASNMSEALNRHKKEIASLKTRLQEIADTVQRASQATPAYAAPEPGPTVAYGQGYGQGYAPAAPPQAPTPQMTEPEALRLAFAEWCQSGGGLMHNIGRFEATLRERYGIPVTLREVYRNCNTIGLEFSGQPFGDSAPYWLATTPQHGTFLLPQPTNAASFKELHEGLFDARVSSPGQVHSVQPAQVTAMPGGGLSVVRPGRIA